MCTSMIVKTRYWDLNFIENVDATSTSDTGQMDLDSDAVYLIEYWIEQQWCIHNKDSSPSGEGV